MESYKNPKTGEVINTELSTMQALVICSTMNSDFARDLEYKSRKYALSDAQLFWVHKLALQEISPKETNKGDKIDASKIYQLFDAASQHLKSPKIRIPYFDRSKECDFTQQEIHLAMSQTVTFSVCGQKSKYPGTIAIVQGQGFGKKFLGRIYKEGFIQTFSQTCPSDLLDFIKDFLTDPIEKAKSYGKIISHCCFCHKTLTDSRSQQVGYGATCAKHFHLPWGEITCSSVI